MKTIKRMAAMGVGASMVMGAMLMGPAAQASVPAISPSLQVQAKYTDAVQQEEIRQAEIAMRYSVLVEERVLFDPVAAIAAGLSPSFAKQFEKALVQVAQSTPPRVPSTDSLTRATGGEMASPALWSPQFNCWLAIAGAIGGTVALVAAAIVTDGGMTAALVMYGLSWTSFIGSCYDSNGRPII